MTEEHDTDVHVYEVTRSYAGGMVFARAVPQEMPDHLTHLGTLNEFAEDVEAELGEYDDGAWYYHDSETATYAYSE